MKRLTLVLAITLSLLAQGQVDHAQHHGPQTAPMGMAGIASELDFIQHMIAHHQEAVESAQQILGISEREEMRSLARDIIQAQGEEIATMRGWLERWYADEDAGADYQPMMRDLSGLTPDRADRAFIEDMIAHHQMAVMDAQQLLMRGLAEHEEVEAMARDIVTVQAQEIGVLKEWLQDWFGTAAAPIIPGMMQEMPMHGMMGEDMMGQGMMSQDMAGMHAMMQGMMQHCVAMMSQMHSGMGQGGMGHGGMSQGMMGQMPVHRMMAQGRAYDQQAVEALARAFLAGYQEGAEITQVDAPANVYTVTFQLGDATGSLLVDAVTGEVRLQDNGD